MPARRAARILCRDFSRTWRSRSTSRLQFPPNWKRERGPQTAEAADADERTRALVARATAAAGDGSAAARSPRAAVGDDDVPAVAVAAVVNWLCETDPLAAGDDDDATDAAAAATAGAVLVFLPGVAEIEDVARELGGRRGVHVLPLHGALPSHEQQACFEPPPRGCRKVVLATNVAESSVTIDDAAYVVNTARVKERRYDVATGVSALETAWCAAASNKQRAGAAGRACARGCACTCSSPSARPRCRATARPRCCACRSPSSACRSPRFCPRRPRPRAAAVARVLATCLDAPSAGAVAEALEKLRGMGALEAAEGGDGAGERLTPLGRHLAALPLGAARRQGAPPRQALRRALARAHHRRRRRPAAVRALRRARRGRRRAPRARGGRRRRNHAALVAAHRGWEEARATGASASGAARTS